MWNRDVDMRSESVFNSVELKINWLNYEVSFMIMRSESENNRLFSISGNIISIMPDILLFT